MSSLPVPIHIFNHGWGCVDKFHTLSWKWVVTHPPPNWSIASYPAWGLNSIGTTHSSTLVFSFSSHSMFSFCNGVIDDGLSFFSHQRVQAPTSVLLCALTRWLAFYRPILDPCLCSSCESACRCPQTPFVIHILNNDMCLFNVQVLHLHPQCSSCLQDESSVPLSALLSFSQSAF